MRTGSPPRWNLSRLVKNYCARHFASRRSTDAIAGRAVGLVGQRLQDVLPRLQREVLDVEVTMTFSRRRHARRGRRVEPSLRLVAVGDTLTGTHRLYPTDIPSERLAPHDIQTVCASRWQIDLLFKERNGTCRIDEVPSRRRCVVEASNVASPAKRPVGSACSSVPCACSSSVTASTSSSSCGAKRRLNSNSRSQVSTLRQGAEVDEADNQRLVAFKYQFAVQQYK